MDSLASARYISVRTMKRSGDPVATPVWVVGIEGKLAFDTPSHTFKVKRIRNNPAVQVAPCTMNGTVTGEWRAGTARIVVPAETEQIIRALRRKYGWSYRVMRLYYRLRRWRSTCIEISLTPEH